MGKTKKQVNITSTVIKKIKVIEKQKEKDLNNMSYKVFIKNIKGRMIESFKFDIFKKTTQINSRIVDLDNLKILNIPSEIDYDEFIWIVCHDLLNKIPVSSWKKLVNIINAYDNTFALYWGCHRSNKKTVELLIKNGALFDPTSKSVDNVPEYYGIENYLDVSGFKNPLLTLIDRYADINENTLDFIKFSDKKLNDYSKFKINEIKNITSTIKLLLEHYPNIFNVFDEENSMIALDNAMKYKAVEIIKLILKADYEFKKNDIKNIILIFKKYIYYYKYKHIIIDTNDDLNIVFKEYQRYKILYILSILYNFLKNKRIKFKDEKEYFNIKKLIYNYFGSYDNYFSIFGSNELNDRNIKYYLGNNKSDYKKDTLNFDQDDNFYYKYIMLFSYYEQEILN
jgi:ankyrin repeat protein